MKYNPFRLSWNDLQIIAPPSSIASVIKNLFTNVSDI